MTIHSKILPTILFLLMVACQSPENSSTSLADRAANEEIARLLEAFPGRGALTDESQPVPAEKALMAFDVAEDLEMDLVLSEPQVNQPLEISFDAKGRLWVVHYNQYPYPEGVKITGLDNHLRVEFDKVPDAPPEGVKGADKITIFEDTDGDGTFDRAIESISGLNIATSATQGYGKIWVLNPPYLISFPDPDGDGIPNGEPTVHLRGFGLQDTHAVANSLRWGPDGWLYGTQGIFTYSRVGKPGTPDEERLEIDAGVWRYHPQKEEFEVFAQGGSNPWGLDFDDYGQAFMIGCVIPHLFHVVQGAYYHRQDGEHFNPFVYNDIKSHADHVHWVGDYGPHAGNNRSAAQGGGHAHAGAMVYLGGSWPEEYHNRIFTNNVHGARTNVDILERRGSGYVGSHGPDFLVANDAWSQMLSLRYGPDGSVFVIDWYDHNQCHSTDPHVHDQSKGRIYRIAHENDAWVQVDLGELSSVELVQLQLHENDWYVRHARRLLQERGPDRQVHRALRQILDEHPDVTRVDAAATIYSDLLRERGYRTGFYGKWHVKMADPAYRGADHFDEFEAIGRNPYYKKQPDGSLRHETEVIVDRGIAFVKNQPPDKPFALNLWFNACHAEDSDRRPGIGFYPWPRSLDGWYEEVTIAPPERNDPAFFESLPEFYRTSLSRERFFWSLNTPQKYQTNLRAYYRMVSGIDRGIGRFLAALEEAGLADNTIVVYSADNGYLMGNRGLSGKWSHFEESLRVPLIVADPRVAASERGKVSRSPVLNLDLPATFLDWAGAVVPVRYQGRSLATGAPRRFTSISRCGTASRPGRDCGTKISNMPATSTRGTTNFSTI